MSSVKLVDFWRKDKEAIEKKIARMIEDYEEKTGLTIESITIGRVPDLKIDLGVKLK